MAADDFGYNGRFQFDEELNRTKVHDGEKSVVGG